MTSALLHELQQRVGCDVTPGAPLATHTTYRIGGPAAVLVTPRGMDEIAEVLQFAVETGTSWLVLGLGSNILVPDRGFDGIVLRLGKPMGSIVRTGGDRWTVGAGLPTPLLARRSAAAGLGGVQRLVGVPGTVGGGVFMNAGAHGQDYSQVVRWVDIIDPGGHARRLRGDDIVWRYRGSGLEGSVVAAASLAFEAGDPALLLRELGHNLRRRRRGTPFDQPCCGSVFRNPGATGDPDVPATAGKLIEAAGLKGYSVGGAGVSGMHANYIVNTGGGTAADVLAVIAHMREEVHRRFDVELELEVKVIT